MSVVGIDLGTTNTVVACVRDGRVHVLADDKGNRLLPSVVSFHPNGDVLVGPMARERRLVDAKNTIASIKRLIGRPWDSEEMRLARARFPFELREGPGQGALVIARGEAYTLPEISAFVLKRVRQIAEAALGETVDKAVITVPAHFNELQRASTKVAGRVAGLEVLRILNEPTAAALAYGFGSEKSERVAVYDFGGGTFDCSLLDLTGSLFEVLATAGDTFLGGDDIDTAVAEVMCNAFLAQHRYDPRVDPQAFERLRAAAEHLKMELSYNTQAQVDLPEVAYGVGGKKLGFTFGLTQADLEGLAKPLVDRTLQVTQDALNIAHLSPSSFDSVVLVGGSTKIPMVKRRVEAFFGIPVIDRVNPDEVVAVGAAVQAASLVDATRRRGIPAAPKPGVIGPPQAVQDDEPQTSATQVTVPSTRSPASGLPPPPPIKTLRPAPPAPQTRITPAPQQNLSRTSEERSLATVPARTHEADAADDSIGTSHTMPAGQAGPASMTNVNMTAVLGAPQARASLPSMSEPATMPSGKSPPSRPPPPLPLRPAAAKPSAQWGPSRPLETEDISRIVPEAAPRAPPRTAPLGARGGTAPMPAAPPASPASGRTVAPLDTDEISMIAPERQSMTGRAPGSRPVPPLPTEDISLISPERPSLSGTMKPRPAALPTEGMTAPEPFNPGARGPGGGPVQPLPTDDISMFSAVPFNAPSRTGANPVAPLPTEDISRISPEPLTGGTLQMPDRPAAAPGRPAPFEFPAVPPAPLRAPPPIKRVDEPARPPPLRRTEDAAPLPHAEVDAPPEAIDFPALRAAVTIPSRPVPAPVMRNALPAPLPTDFAPPAGWQNAAAPVLVDVTPRALVVETVGGYCDTVIVRNARIPCEHTRVFATGRDNQTTVHVRVAQGEDTRFEENQYLGELELTELRPAARGELLLSVTFELDANGSLVVKAVDTSTGREAHANMKLVAVAQSDEEIEEMIERSRSVSVTG